MAEPWGPGLLWGQGQETHGVVAAVQSWHASGHPRPSWPRWQGRRCWDDSPVFPTPVWMPGLFPTRREASVKAACGGDKHASGPSLLSHCPPGTTTFVSPRAAPHGYVSGLEIMVFAPVGPDQ